MFAASSTQNTCRFCAFSELRKVDRPVLLGVLNLIKLQSTDPGELLLL
jgi:hypothetical protein